MWENVDWLVSNERHLSLFRVTLRSFSSVQETYNYGHWFLIGLGLELGSTDSGTSSLPIYWFCFFLLQFGWICPAGFLDWSWDTCLITDVLSPLLFAWFWAWASNHLNIGVKFWESMTPPFQTIFSLFLVTSEIRKELYTEFGHTNPVNPYSSRISSNYIWTDFLWNLRYVDNAKSGVWP